MTDCIQSSLEFEKDSRCSSKIKNKSQKNGELPLFSKKVYCACCGKAFNKNNVKLKDKNKEYLQCKSKSHSSEYM